MQYRRHSERGGDDAAVGGQHHRPELRIPVETLRLGQVARESHLDGADVARVVDLSHLLTAERSWSGQLDVWNW